MCHWTYISLMRWDLAWVITEEVLHRGLLYHHFANKIISRKSTFWAKPPLVQRHFPSFIGRLRKQKLEIMPQVEAVTIYAAWG